MLKSLRNWLSPAPPSVVPIIAEIDRLKLYMSCMVYGGTDLYVHRTWSVTLREEWKGFKLEVEAEGRTFDEALSAAWAKRPIAKPNREVAA